MQRQTNLTTGPILGTLMSLALPIMASSFFSTAYNLTDMMWIGRLGSQAVAGIGSAGMFLWFSYGLCTLARMGGQVWTGQMLGRDDRKQASRYAAGALRLIILIGCLFSLVCILFAPAMLSIFHITDSVTLQSAIIYLRITGAFQIFAFINAVLTGLFTAQGDSRTPLAANTTGLILNMILDPLLILGIGPFPRMEVTGAAVATVSAEVLSTLVFLPAQRIRIKRGGLRLTGTGRIPSKIYHDIIRIGLPSALQSSLYTAFSMFLTRLCSDFGPATIAVQRLGGQIESVTWNAADGFGTAMNAFTAQNYGAGYYERIKKGYNFSLLCVSGWGFLITALFILFPRPIASIFFFEEEPVRIFIRYLVIVGLAEAFMSAELMANGSISGFGETRVCSAISIILTGARVPLALLLTRTSMGSDGIWWALCTTSMAKGIVLNLAFRLVYRKKKREG